MLQSDGFWKTFHLEILQRGSGAQASGHASPALAVSPAMVVRMHRRYRLQKLQ